MPSNKAFCCRCKVAYACHATTGSACGNYIAPDSDAGRAMARAEAATKIDAPALDYILIAETIEALEARIKQATQATQACLLAAREGAPRTASRYAERALKALGGLGAS